MRELARLSAKERWKASRKREAADFHFRRVAESDAVVVFGLLRALPPKPRRRSKRSNQFRGFRNATGCGEYGLNCEIQVWLPRTMVKLTALSLVC